MQWEYEKFGSWLRRARVGRLPVISQDQLAETLGAAQSKVSRWENERPGTEAPTLDECLVLSDLFDVDFIELAKLCGRWNDRIEQRVLVSLASTGNQLSHAPVAQLSLGRMRRNTRPAARPLAA